MFILLTIIGLSLLIIVHEFGHFITAKLFGLRVDEFGFGLPPRALGKKFGETIYSLNWLPFGGFVKIYGEDTAGEQVTMARKQKEVSDDLQNRSFAYQSAWKRSVVILSGVTMNFILGWILISTVLMIGREAGIYISQIDPSGPAVGAGIMLGDRIIGYTKAEEFIKYVNDNRGAEIKFTVLRAGNNEVISVVPRLSPPPNQGALGIALDEEDGIKLGFFEAFYSGAVATYNLIWLILSAFFGFISSLFTQGANLSDVSGPIGIFKIAGTAGALGIATFLNFFALISINLGVINALPFPALDGGRFLFILIEKIKGSPLPVKFERIANGIGFALLIVLMILVTIRDIQNIVTG